MFAFQRSRVSLSRGKQWKDIPLPDTDFFPLEVEGQFTALQLTIVLL